MKLRNKKTGEIKECAVIPIIDGYVNEYEVFEKADTLAELNEEWEDYKESEFWYVEAWGKISKINLKNDLLIEPLRVEETKGIGNYFETKEEAEKAVEKLKAWKRLKDKGFEFTGWDRHPDFPGDFRITAGDEYTCDDKDLDLLFGGVE